MIKFTEHSEIRLSERGIDRDFVEETVLSPDVILPAKSNRKIALKKFDERFLKAVFVKEGDDIIIITCHWISNIKKELK